jgi:hypothetical protein
MAWGSMSKANSMHVSTSIGSLLLFYYHITTTTVTIIIITFNHLYNTFHVLYV